MFCNVRMIPAKLSYFMYFACFGCYANYLNIFYRDVGLTVAECGLISGVTLACMGVCSPLWGLVVDYTGRRKLIFFVLFIGYISLMFPLPFVAAAINTKYVAANSTTSNCTVGDNTQCLDTPSRKPFSSLLFFALLSMEVTSKIFIAPLHAMIDAAVMNIIETKEPGTSFGVQRLYGSFSFGFLVFITGIAIDRFEGYFTAHHLSKYTVSFCIFLPLAVSCIPVCLYLLNQDDTGKPREIKTMKHSNRDEDIREINTVKHSNAEKDNIRGMNKINHSDGDNGTEANTGINKLAIVISTFRKFSNTFFLITVFVQGISNMLIVAYLFLLMKDQMHSTKMIMGLSSFITSISQVAIFPFADKVIERCGGPIVSMEVAVFSYFVRHLFNSYIINPWLVLATQLLHGLSFALFWAAVVVHTKKIAPKEIYVTMFTIVNSAYFGMGGISANLLGGFIYSKYGGDVLFRGTAVLCGLWTFLMLVYYHGSSYMRRICGNRVLPVQ